MLTPAIPTSIVIKLVASVPGTSTGTVYNVCNPTLAFSPTGGGLPGNNNIQSLERGLLAWGTTLEPASTAGTYSPVSVPFIIGSLPTTFTDGEINQLASVCAPVQAEGTGYGVCSSCALGALSGTKQ
ncbi:MAG: hypothetical protein ABSB35_05450 [Bryobacteraceae bacterium]